MELTMNRILSLSLITLIAIPAAQAVDIKTDISCKKLVIAISQAHSLETCTAAWQKVTESSTITAQDRIDILKQLLQTNIANLESIISYLQELLTATGNV
jgi:hypothetical protein